MARTADRLAWGSVFVCVLAAATAGAQAVPPPRSSLAMPTGSLSTAAAAVLQQMAGRAGVIFSGQVERVERNDAAGFVDVHFRITQAVRGCPAGGVYVLREWAGLWMAHPERYRAGQRFLMLLAARGPSGMSAPVGGMDGAIPILGTVAEPIANAAGIGPADAGTAAEDAVDLRWIEARMQRATVTSNVKAHATASAEHVSAEHAGTQHADTQHASTQQWTGPTAALGASASSLSAVLSLLRGGDGVSDAQR